MSDPITITPRFRRSVRIDTDFASVAAIDGFYCPPSFQAAVTFMAAHVADTEQGAFTWTGPYGGGKSSLALALACLFGAPKPVREQVAALFGDKVTAALKLLYLISQLAGAFYHSSLNVALFLRNSPSI